MLTQQRRRGAAAGDFSSRKAAIVNAMHAAGWAAFFEYGGFGMIFLR